MKKKIIALICCFMLIICFFPFQFAYADPLTAAQIGIASYAAMQSWGINFSVSNPSGKLGDFMGTQVDTYVNSLGGSISSVFGDQLLIDSAGKLAMGQTMYNGVIGFTNWLSTKFNLGASETSITRGYYGNAWLDIQTESQGISTEGISVIFSNYTAPTSGQPYGGYQTYTYYNNGGQVASHNCDSIYRFIGEWYVTLEGNFIYLITPEHHRTNGSIFNYKQSLGYVSPSSITDGLSWDGSDYVQPTVIDPSYEWLGQVGDYQDTNLEQLLEHILEALDGGILSVEGEVVPIDPPQPEPTPIPIDPETPLQDVPWEGLNDLLDLTNGRLESIDEALSGVDSGIGTISGQLDDVNEQIGEQTDALTDSLEGVQEGISDLTDVVTEALTAPEIDEKTFDLRELFPFCIPFDIYHLLQKFDGSPTAPHVQLPIVIPSIGFSYIMDLDFSAWDTVAAAMRTVELIVYALGLAWATSKVIKW